jgi:hypothetical protein
MNFDYTVRCSAVLDRSSAVKSLTDWISLATAAKKKVDEILGAPVKVAGGKSPAKVEADARITEAQRAAKELERIRERENNQILRDVEKQTRAEERAHERAQRYVAGVKDRYFAQQQKEEEKADNKRQARAKQIASDSLSNMRAVAGAAARIGGEVVGGLGVSFSLSQGVTKARDLEKMAVDITNAANRGQGGAAGAQARSRQPTELLDFARGIGEKYAIDPTQAMRGIAQYQALTGDLDTAKAGMDDLAKLSKAFGTNLDDMVGAAGQIGSAIGDVGKEFKTPEEKAKVLYELLKQATAQGQEGAIEIADLAREYAKLKGAGVKFEGGAAANIGKMSALAQLSYQTGGAGSIREATNSVVGFANTLGTVARRREFKAAGIEIENKKGEFLDPYTIIRESLRKTGGDTDKMNALFKNVLGAKAVASFSTAFRGAGGGEAGIAAVDAILKKFSGTVSEDVIKENLGRSMGTKESKAIEFQNRLDKISADFVEKVVPSLEKLAGPAADAADALASIVAWAASNPLAAVGITIAGSIAAAIAKATIGELIGKAIGQAVSSGMAGKGLAIGAVTATVAMAYLAIREYNEQKQKAAENEVEKRAETAQLLKKAQQQIESTGKLDPDTARELIARRADVRRSLKSAEIYKSDENLNWFEKFGAKVADVVTGEDLSKSKAELEGAGAQNVKDRETLNQQKAQLDALIGAVKDGKIKGPIDVNVLNQPAAGGPSVDQSGRAPQ